MAEETKKILNLKALKVKDIQDPPSEDIKENGISQSVEEKKEDKEDVIIEKNLEKKEESFDDAQKKIPKISLGLGTKIQSLENTDTENTIGKENVDAAEEGSKKNEKNSEVSKKEEIKNDAVEFTRKKISLTSQLSKQADEKIIQEQEDEKMQNALSLETEEENHQNKENPKKNISFVNYESGFQKQSVNVIKKIQNFRYTPKTRTSLVIGLITLCMLIVSGLMIFFPEKHSLSIYKASILEIYNSQTNDVVVNPPSIINQENINEEINIPTDLIENEQDNQEAIESGENIENSQKSIIETKKVRLKNYLLDKYSESK